MSDKDIMLVLNEFKEPCRVDDDSSWDLGKARVRYCPASERDELLKDMRELLKRFCGGAGDGQKIVELRKKWGEK